MLVKKQKKSYVIIGVISILVLFSAWILILWHILAPGSTKTTWRTIFLRFEPVEVQIVQWLDIAIPDNLPTPEEPDIYMVIEAIKDESGNLPPMPEVTRFLYAEVRNDLFLDSITFTQPGIFRYRIYLEVIGELIATDG